jgi:hypothetical protein
MQFSVWIKGIIQNFVCYLSVGETYQFDTVNVLHPLQNLKFDKKALDSILTYTSLSPEEFSGIFTMADRTYNLIDMRMSSRS